MRSPAHKLNDWRLFLVASSALLAPGALAQQDAPVQPANPGAPESAQADGSGQTSPEGLEMTDGETGESQSGVGASQVSPGITVLARWVRAASCRIFIDFPVDERTRFSPSKRDKQAEWRISIPRFAGVYVSSIGGSAVELPAEEGDVIAGAETTPAAGEGAAAAAEGAPGGVEAPAAAAPVQPQLTWTQRVGLVKADPPAPSSGAERPAATGAQPTWTQRVGLLKSPSTAEPASGGVASFSKKKAEEKKD